ncbi:MurR/RpiR family transcriptional regulator [Paenisporosarcina sp. TG20]|uniref:MurR/RpiR family transcriptional regulator n=1 Tax=Paenisporosarcina sp. TG20 TaxID=1211706 RepID=UPI0002D4AE12|nr:MurR/RpiR family transcriptional regulator [Paenisporosarcina sp. TG20]
MKDLLHKIEDSYNDFSAGQKRIADLFKENQIVLAFSSALEVGKKVGVSESTVIRWAQKIGFKGYADFQHVIQKKLAEQRIEQVEDDDTKYASQSIVKNLLDADIKSISQLKETLQEEQLLQVVDLIGSAKKIYVTSNFFDYGLAHSFAHWMNMMLNNTKLLMQEDVQYYHQLSKLTEEDVLIAFAFPRYTKKLMEILEIAKEQGTTIIIITDNKDAPVMSFADIALFVPISTSLNIDSYTAVHALLTSIMRFIYVKEHDKVKQNLDSLDAAYERNDIFVKTRTIVTNEY